MLARDIEMFIEHCGLKGLSTKTINSYEQTLRLFMQYMDEQGILLTEKITHLAIQGYIKSIYHLKIGRTTMVKRTGAIIRSIASVHYIWTMKKAFALSSSVLTRKRNPLHGALLTHG